MDQTRPVQQVMNASGQAQQPANVMSNGAPLQQPYRPLQVAEALQYSPMTSAPIFGLGMLHHRQLNELIADTSPFLHCRDPPSSGDWRAIVIFYCLAVSPIHRAEVAGRAGL